MNPKILKSLCHVASVKHVKQEKLCRKRVNGQKVTGLHRKKVRKEAYSWGGGGGGGGG